MKGICYLICAGEKAELSFTPCENDMVIAVDGGYKYLTEEGKTADIIIGDFDSLGNIPTTNNVIKLSPVKDVTDTFAGIDEGLKRGYKSFRLYCALGGRLSHTMANINALRYIKIHGGQAKIISDNATLEIIDDIAEFAEGGYLSLIPLTEKAEVEIKNCKYSGSFTFTCSDSLGVSNEPLAGASVKVLSGEVLSIIEEK